MPGGSLSATIEFRAVGPQIARRWGPLGVIWFARRWRVVGAHHHGWFVLLGMGLGRWARWWQWPPER